ncbi:MAG TPA: type II toxin-antitoxin system VapC family toxin [Thermoanaerobaculia bacterium]|nr:type II toxin-antitoxin system VapC family toxin [Thermoanaerobaculia bacterium]
MKLLLDTHIFIWWDSEPAKLSRAVLDLCADPAHELIVSVASLWEMQIKRHLGKLDLRLPLAEIVVHQQETNGITILPVAQAHVLALEQLPNHHRDPFDRILVAQALVEGAALVSADPILKSYPVEVRA